MKIYKLGLVLAFVLLNISCKGNSDSGPANNSLDTGNPTGTFNTTKVVAGDYTGNYTVGCTSPGVSTPTNQLDTRLTAGMNFGETIQFKAPSLSGNLSFTENIQSVNSSTVVSLMTAGNSTISVIPAGSQFTETCTTDGNGSFNCVTTPQVQGDVNIPDEHCEVTSVTSSSEHFNVGTYTFANGKTVDALERKGTYTGHLTCDHYDGDGTFEYHAMTSNDIPARDIYYCGGVDIFSFGSSKKADGTVISAVAYEMTDAPVSPAAKGVNHL